MDIDGSVAVVTGGASGLGLATARRLVEAGAQVVLLDLPSSSGEEAARRLGDGRRFAAADVDRRGRGARRRSTRAAALGPLRVVVNCAGIGTPGRVVGRDGALPLDAVRAGSSRST